MEPPSRVAAGIRREMGKAVIVCILGPSQCQCEHSEELVKAIAAQLSGCEEANACVFVTGGMPGVQKTFAEHCHEGTQLYNVLPTGQSSGFARGRDLHAGEDLEQRMQVFGHLGDLYITVEGGTGAVTEVKSALARGACVVPLIRTGGASGGMFDFPPEALERPPFADLGDWLQLSRHDAPIEQTASAVRNLVASYIQIYAKDKVATIGRVKTPMAGAARKVDLIATASASSGWSRANSFSSSRSSPRPASSSRSSPRPGSGISARLLSAGSMVLAPVIRSGSSEFSRNGAPPSPSPRPATRFDSDDTSRIFVAVQ